MGTTGTRRTIVVGTLATLLVAASGVGPGAVAATRTPGVRELTGTVTAVSEQDRTLTVKGAGGRRTHAYTFTVEAGATGALAGLKPGQRVKVTYVKRQGHLTAQAITSLSTAAAK